MRAGFPIVVALACLVAVPAAGQMRQSDFVILTADTDDAIRLAKSIKDFFATDPTARRIVGQARDVIIQSWLEEKSPDQLTDRERAAVQNPERYDTPILHDVTVTLSASPPGIVIGWDIPPRLWPRLAGAMAQVVNRVAQDGAFFARRTLQLRVKLRDAEVYRVNADVDGNITVVFIYE